jgi:hypothetical protein
LYAERLGLSGSDFAPSIEFKIGRRLVEAGLYAKLREDGVIAKGNWSIPAHRALDRDLVDVVVEFMKQKPIRKFLEDEALTKSARARVKDVVR